MDDLTMWSLLVGFFSPLLISVVQQPGWSEVKRAVTTGLFALVVGAGTAYFNDDLTGRGVTSAVLVVLVTALATYKGLWKPTGVAPSVEAATSSSGERGRVDVLTVLLVAVLVVVVLILLGVTIDVG